MFNVVDTVPPVIIIEEGYNENIQVTILAGQKLSFTYTVTDNIDEELTTYVILSNVRTLKTHTYNSGTFFVSEAGEYDVYVVCVDEAGNMATVKFTLIAVKEGK